MTLSGDGKGINVPSRMTRQEAIERLQLRLKISKHELFEIPPEYRRSRGEQLTLDIKMYEDAIEALRFQQSVVRCKDCSHKVDREFSRVICLRHSIQTHKNGYCHAGKRRDEE